MKWFICISLVFLYSFDEGKQALTKQDSWVVEKNSSLVIKGSSNINSFTCDVRRYLHNDTLNYTTDPKGRHLNFQRRTVTINVDEIDCHHKFITSDLRKTLNYQEYPYLKIHFVSLDDPTVMQPGQSIKGLVDIEMAGNVKRIEMHYAVRNQGGRIFHLSGTKDLVFSDFKLEPPRKLAGLIHINEELRVSVELFFRKIS